MSPSRVARNIPLTVEGPKIRLRKLLSADVDRLRQWLRDPSILAAHPAGATFPDTFPLETFVFGPGDLFSLQYAITTRGNDRLIGLAGLYLVNWTNGSAEVGLIIGEATERGSGYGTEVIGRLGRTAGQALGLNRLVARILASNQPARRCFARAGFTEERDGIWVLEL